MSDDTASFDSFEIPPGTFVEYLGLDFREVSGDRVVATWTAGPKHHQPFGIVHGGVHCSVVETLGSFGATYWLLARDPQATAVGVNNSTDFFRAVTEGAMTSTGVPLHQGRLQQLWLIETRSDADDRLVARGQVRLQNLYPESREAPKTELGSLRHGAYRPRHGPQEPGDPGPRRRRGARLLRPVRGVRRDRRGWGRPTSTSSRWPRSRGRSVPTPG